VKENEIRAYFLKIDQALEADAIDQASILAVELDLLIRQAVDAKELDVAGLESINGQLKLVSEKLLAARKKMLSEMAKISKGATGIKAYKGV